ncbi:hypothetical protein AB0J82_22695 [Asanoa sp. NPDC049518]|uniref:hypothetical protein n=1 Tax=unclassified Asanoa TaxID=2685164 RepID=UPI003442A0C5
MLSRPGETGARQPAELLDFFGVETRFQAGLALGMSCADPFPKPYAQENAAPRRPRVAGRPDRTGP